MAKLGNAFMSLFLDKRARETLKATNKATNRATKTASPTPAPAQSAPSPRPAPEPHPTQDEINARLDEAVEARAKNAASPNRQALIRDALKIRADKAKMLDDLPEEQRRKLQAMAMLAMRRPPPKG